MLVIAGQAVEGQVPRGVSYGSMSDLMREQLPSVVLEKSVVAEDILPRVDGQLKGMRVVACVLAAHPLWPLATPNPLTILFRLLEVSRSNLSCLLPAPTVWS